MSTSKSGWVTLRSGRRAAVGAAAHRRFPDGRRGFFVLGRKREDPKNAAPIAAHGYIALGRVHVQSGVLGFIESAELVRFAEELERASHALLREALA